MADLEARAAAVIHEGRGIGWITLGASLHAILTRLKARPESYPALDLSYSASDPIAQPIVLNLPENGIRLRFDGPDQRLRLIEVLDFSKIALTFHNVELVRRDKSSDDGAFEPAPPAQGPKYSHIYNNRLFGPTYPGEYVAPERKSGNSMGTYVLSYPGVSFSFPVQHKAWSEKPNSVPLLSSNAAGPATSMAIYQGSSWAEARATIFTAVPELPRSLALSSRNKDAVPDEIEEIRILGAGRLEIVRRASPTVQIVLNETTPQNLVAELGPPDAIYRKSDKHPSIHATRAAKANRQASMSPMMRPNTTESDQSSAHSYTEDSDEGAQTQADSDVNPECFYNYFHHGFDVFVSSPQTPSPPFPESKIVSSSQFPAAGAHLVITKILLHANIPGSHSFNRHRRSRWTITTASPNGPLTSEMSFPELSSKLKSVWHSIYADAEQERTMQLGHVLNRGWDQTPESSVELLGGFEEQDFEEKKGGGTGPEESEGMSNPLLFGFPGLLFEVLKNDVDVAAKIESGAARSHMDPGVQTEEMDEIIASVHDPEGGAAVRNATVNTSTVGMDPQKYTCLTVGKSAPTEHRMVFSGAVCNGRASSGSTSEKGRILETIYAEQISYLNAHECLLQVKMGKLCTPSIQISSQTMLIR